MFQVAPQSRIFLAVEAVDFRRGIDGLAAICRQQLKEDPLSGCVFVFRNRRRNSIKLLAYDGQGFWIAQKRLSQGKLSWWPRSNRVSYRLAVSELQLLLWNGNPHTAQIPQDWRTLHPPSSPVSAE